MESAPYSGEVLAGSGMAAAGSDIELESVVSDAPNIRIIKEIARAEAGLDREGLRLERRYFTALKDGSLAPLIPAVRTVRNFILNCLYAALIAVKVARKFRLLGHAHDTSFETIIRKITVSGIGRPLGAITALLPRGQRDA